MATRLFPLSLRLERVAGFLYQRKAVYGTLSCMARSLSTAAPSPSADALPAWLQSVRNDRSAAPRVYRWPVDDVVGGTSGTVLTAAGDCGPSDARRIYILGVGNLGRLFAAALAQLPDRPPITLVVHRPALLAHWRQKPGVRLYPKSYLDAEQPSTATDDDDSTFAGFDVEMWSDECPPSASERPAELPPITNLIVATKAQAALGQVDRVRRYLGPASTVAFVQNGMNRLWPPYGALYNAARYGSDDDDSHPRWLACVVTHGVVSLGPFASVLASPADVKLGGVGGGSGGGSGGSGGDRGDGGGSYLVQQLLAAPVLAAQALPPAALWVTQLEKLAVNAVINPLTALLRCRNGGVFQEDTAAGAGTGAGADDDCLSRIIDRLLLEASRVFQDLARHDPSSRHLLEGPEAAGLLDRLAFPALKAMVYRVGALVGANTSSMLQDVRAGRPTEIRDLNGWIVDAAAYLGGLGVAGLDVTAHRTLVALIEAGEALQRGELGRHFPEEEPGR